MRLALWPRKDHVSATELALIDLVPSKQRPSNFAAAGLRTTSEDDDIDKMEDDMTRLIEDMDATPRRGFFARMAGAMALGLAGFATAPRDAQAAANASDWPGALKGKNRQVVDAYEPNAGFPLAFVHTFLLPNDPADTSALLVLRHGAFPFALESAMWQKYKIGEAMKINDPETKAPAVKNPFYKPKSGALLIDDMAVDRLLAKGVIIGACNVALTVQSKMLSGNAGVTPEEALKEWTANIIPGITVIPSGTWGVNRAQQAGCSYCAGG
jgi:hypothetical protein